MKTCPQCGKRIYRDLPDTSEYGISVVDGGKYPDTCPRCGTQLE